MRGRAEIDSDVRPWEPEPLELPLDDPYRRLPVPSEGGRTPGDGWDEEELPGATVIVIDLL